MPDRITAEKRSEIMSKIRSSGTKSEVRVRLWLYHHGIRYRKNYSELPGKPDIAITKYKIAVFINGCFWHGHDNCKYFRMPKTSLEYWEEKIRNNKRRDQETSERLVHAGWIVITIWECELKADFDGTMEGLLEKIQAIKLFQADKSSSPFFDN